MLLETLTPTLSPKQLWSIGASTGRVNLWEGSIRSGKTFASLLRWMMFVANAPATGELVMIGKSRDTIYRNVLAPMMNAPEYGALSQFVNYKPGATVAHIFGRTVHVIGANDAKSEAKIRGMTVSGAYVDEVTVIPSDFFKMLLGRMSVIGAQLFATTNPDSPAHWLKVEYLDQLAALPDWRRFHFTLEDNVALDPAFVASIKREYGSGLWYQRFILGLWVAAEGAIYNMWREETHVRPWATLPPMNRMLAVGVDYGTTNATAAILLAMSRETLGDRSVSRLWLIDEWSYDSKVTGQALTDSEQSTLFRKWLDGPHLPEGNPGRAYRPRFILVDPAAASFRAQLQKDGVTTGPANNDVGGGIRTVANLFINHQLMVSDRCTRLRSEVPAYSWDAHLSEKGGDVPVKSNDHAADAMRYAVATTEAVWRPHLTWPLLDRIAYQPDAPPAPRTRDGRYYRAAPAR